jgi:hypothetical protein
MPTVVNQPARHGGQCCQPRIGGQVLLLDGFDVSRRDALFEGIVE